MAWSQRSGVTLRLSVAHQLPDPLALRRAIEAGEPLDDHLWMLIASVNHRMAAISRRVR